MEADSTVPLRRSRRFDSTASVDRYSEHSLHAEFQIEEISSKF